MCGSQERSYVHIAFAQHLVNCRATPFIMFSSYPCSVPKLEENNIVLQIYGSPIDTRIL